MITETGISAWLITKIAPTLAALFGGLSLVLFWTPERLLQKGKVVSVFIAGAVAAVSGFTLTGVVAMMLGVSPESLDIIIGIAWTIGFFSLALFNWGANFIARREHQDIAEVYNEVKDIRNGRAKPARPIKPVRRVRKAVAK